MDALSKAGVNWAGIDALSKAGVNWSDINVLSKSGVNWSDLDVMTNAGVNWMFAVDRMTVDRWREAGGFAGSCFNKATGTQREHWWFLREAVLKFAATRVG
jgi:hypothetical protein